MDYQKSIKRFGETGVGRGYTVLVEANFFHPSHSHATPQCRNSFRVTLVPMPVGGRRNNPEFEGSDIESAITQALAFLQDKPVIKRAASEAVPQYLSYYERNKEKIKAYQRDYYGRRKAAQVQLAKEVND